MKSTTLLHGAWVAVAHFSTALAASHAGVHVGSHVARAASPTGLLQVPSAVPVQGEYQSSGCYSSNGNMTLNPPISSLSSGLCNKACSGGGYYVSALQGTNCFCGFAYPPASDVANDTSCSFACPGYGNEACGSLGQPPFFSVWNTGVNVDPPIYTPVSSTTAAPTSTIVPSTSSTAAATHSETATASSKPSSGSSNVTGIAAGTVAGVVALAGLAGAAFFLMRRRRNAEIEEEHRRNAAVNAFINGSKPPSTSGSISMTDSRLDPVMAHRRLSDGSIADNEDYSRRILRVTNA